METLFGKTLRLRKESLLKLWYSGIAGPLLLLFILFGFDGSLQLIKSLPNYVWIFLIIIGYGFIQSAWDAIYWTMFSVRCDAVALHAKTLFGKKQVIWSSLQGLGEDTSGTVVTLRDSAGKETYLNTALEGFPDILQYAIKCLEPSISNTGRDVFNAETPKVKSIIMLVFFSAIFVVFSWFIAKEYVVMVIFWMVLMAGYMVKDLLTGLRRVEVNNGAIEFVYLFKRKTIELDEVKHVSLTLMSPDNASTKQYERLTVNLTTEYLGDIPILLTGSDLLPLYYRLNRAVNKG